MQLAFTNHMYYHMQECDDNTRNRINAKMLIATIIHTNAKMKCENCFWFGPDPGAPRC